MKQTITHTGGYRLVAELKKAAVTPDIWVLELTSRFTGAADPNEDRMVAKIVMDRSGAIAMQQLFNEGVK